jgi:FMN-dependent oxidoreductase (nitrilotriacetate monooxygenase family)
MHNRKTMKLAMMWFAPGSHGAGWRMPGAARSTVTNFDTYVEVARKCEEAKLDALFFADGNAIQPTPLIEKRDKAAEKFYRAAIIEAMSVIPALAAVTSKLGLIATGTTTYNEPYTIARRFATIDLISKGRAGWNLVTSQHENEAQNFGFEKHMEHDERYVRAEEFFDVVTGLWNSWDTDALLQDKENARYFDVEKVHVLNHKGKYFNVKGPLNVPRSPQGRPIIVQAGSSGPGRNLAARIADLVFSANSTIEESKAFTDDLKARAVACGRSADAIKLMPGFMPIIGRTEAEAKEHYLQLQSLITDEQALIAISRFAGGVDLSQYPLDGPLPELPTVNGAQTRQQIMIETARRENLSIRQIGRRFAESLGHNLVWGTPAQVADIMEEWFSQGACDGFCILPPYFPRGVDDFTGLVVPELQRRGLFRTEYEGRTLRENLGLPAPVETKRVMVEA